MTEWEGPDCISRLCVSGPGVEECGRGKLHYGCGPRLSESLCGDSAESAGAMLSGSAVVLSLAT